MPSTSYTKQSWANGDPTKPLNAARLAHLEGQADAAVDDTLEQVQAQIGDSGTPIGGALETTIGAVADTRSEKVFFSPLDVANGVLPAAGVTASGHRFVNTASSGSGFVLGTESLTGASGLRSEEHTSETPVTNAHLVCRLLLEKKNHNYTNTTLTQY